MPAIEALGAIPSGQRSPCYTHTLSRRCGRDSKSLKISFHTGQNLLQRLQLRTGHCRNAVRFQSGKTVLPHGLIPLCAKLTATTAVLQKSNFFAQPNWNGHCIIRRGAAVLHVPSNCAGSEQVYVTSNLETEAEIDEKTPLIVWYSVYDEDLRDVACELRSMFPPEKVGDDAIANSRLLMAIGVPASSIPRMFSITPALLNYDPRESRILPLLRVFLEHGIRQDEAIKAFSTHSAFIRVSPSAAAETLVCLSANLGVKRLGKVVRGFPGIMGYSRSTLEEKAEFLRGLGITDVGHALEHFPALLGYGTDQMRCKVESLQAVMGVDDVATILDKHPTILGMRADTIKETFEKLSGVFGKERVVDLVQRAPQVIQNSWGRIAPKIEFLLHEMYRDSEEVLRTPAALTFSLERRMRPRFEALKKVGLADEYSLSYIFNCSDDVFESRLARLGSVRSSRGSKSVGGSTNQEAQNLSGDQDSHGDSLSQSLSQKEEGGAGEENDESGRDKAGGVFGRQKGRGRRKLNGRSLASEESYKADSTFL